jgi:AcrR family transcriptional regulator
MNPTTRQPHDLREELVQASLEILREPDTRLDVREVCRRVNRSQTATYTVFGKEKDGGGFTALLAAVATRGFEDLGARLDSARGESEDDPAAGLEAMSHAYLNFARLERGLYRVMFGEKLKTWVSAREGWQADSTFADLVQARLNVQEILTSGIAEARDMGAVAGRSDLEHALHAWATLHGLVELTMAGQFEMLFTHEPLQRFLDDSIHHLILSMRERS